MENQLAVNNQSVANQVPGMEWLYQGGGTRISINNKTRNGFVVKNSGEEISELVAQITNIKSLHSHRQPDKKRDEPRHASTNDWCQSFDNKHTNESGASCSGCPAYDSCAWKLEFEMTLAGREESFAMTIPTVSAMRFKTAYTKLDRVWHKHIVDVVWKMAVEVVEKDGNVFPAITFKPCNPQTGEVFEGKPTPTKIQAKSTFPLIDRLSSLAGDYSQSPNEQQLLKMRGLLAGTLDTLLGFDHKDFVHALYPQSNGSINALPANWVGAMLNWLGLKKNDETKKYEFTSETDVAKVLMHEFWKDYQKAHGQGDLF